MERVGYAAPVSERLEQVESLLLIGQRPLDATSIHVPVAHTIEAARNVDSVAQFVCHRQRARRVLTSYRIVARRPQHIQVDLAFPRQAQIATRGCCRERGLVVGACRLELAQAVVRLTAPAENLGRRRLSSLPGSLDATPEMFDGRAGRVHAERALTRLRSVAHRPGPGVRGVRVVRQLLHCPCFSLFEGDQHLGVQGAPFPPQQI